LFRNAEHPQHFESRVKNYCVTMLTYWFSPGEDHCPNPDWAPAFQMIEKASPCSSEINVTGYDLVDCCSISRLMAESEQYTPGGHNYRLTTRPVQMLHANTPPHQWPAASPRQTWWSSMHSIIKPEIITDYDVLKNTTAIRPWIQNTPVIW
jgi:hypothetical protein